MLTLLFATRDRSRLLGEVLESFCLLCEPPGGWKLVVVDNGSKDDTSRVLESFSKRLPLHAVFEPIPGKNHALNAGLPWIEGDLAIFTDDDVFPRADWLVQLRNAADTHPEYSIFGGLILPRWEAPLPSWTEWIDLAPVFATTPASVREGEVIPGLVFGPNMAIRAAIFQAGTRFDPSIGPKGMSYAMGSETELIERLCLHGSKAWHVPGAVVEHFVRSTQLTSDWVLKRAVRYGRGQYRLWRKDPTATTKLWFGIPRHMFRDIPTQIGRIVAAWVRSRPDALFQARWRLNYLCGQTIEARAIARDQRARPIGG